MEKFNTISTGVIALATVIGVAGAIGSFLIELELPVRKIFFNLLIYIIVMLLYVGWLKEEIK